MFFFFIKPNSVLKTYQNVCRSLIESTRHAILLTGVTHPSASANLCGNVEVSTKIWTSPQS